MRAAHHAGNNQRELSADGVVWKRSRACMCAGLPGAVRWRTVVAMRRGATEGDMRSLVVSKRESSPSPCPPEHQSVVLRT